MEIKVGKNVEKKLDWIELEDGTRIVLNKSAKELTFLYPTKKFWRIFEAQKDKEFLSIAWSVDEIDAIMKGIEMIEGGINE